MQDEPPEISFLCWRAEKSIFPSEIPWNLETQQRSLKYSNDL